MCQSNVCRLTLSQKCDGIKPACGPCSRGHKFDCYYDQDPQKSRTAELEEMVSRLESRIHELEDPNHTTPSVYLHDPYTLSGNIPTSHNSTEVCDSCLYICAFIHGCTRNRRLCGIKICQSIYVIPYYSRCYSIISLSLEHNSYNVEESIQEFHEHNDSSNVCDSFYIYILR